MSDLWITASADVEAENRLRRLTAARAHLGTTWSFLMRSASAIEYANRKSLVAERIADAVIAAVGDVDEKLVGDLTTSLDTDFAAFEGERMATRVEASIKQAALSRDCTNGNHSDCSGGSCTCSCHKRGSKDYSGACADGDHGSCKMSHGSGDDDCQCPDPSHRTTASRRTAAGREHRIIPSEQAGYGPGKHVVQYRDPDMKTWFDIGDPLSKEDAEKRLRERHSTASLRVEAVAWSRQHYEHLASALSEFPDGGKAANHFASALDGTNPNYRRDQFSKAATTPGYKARGGKTASMTRGHFQHIADTVKSYDGDRAALANHLADRLGSTNGGFDRARFLKASTGTLVTASEAGWYVIQRGTGTQSGGPYPSQEAAEQAAAAANYRNGTNDYQATELGDDGLDGKSGSRKTAEEHGGYHIEGDGPYKVVNHIGEVKSTFDSKDDALSYQRALMVNVPGAKEDAERHEENGDKAKHSSKTAEYGYIHDKPGRPCPACAAAGRLTWLNDDGTCRRADAHRKGSKTAGQRSWTMGEGEGSLKEMSDDDLAENISFWEGEGQSLSKDQAEANLKMLRAEQARRSGTTATKTAGNQDPIAYTYEADVHCPECARKRFGDKLDDPNTEDGEGNPIGVIAPWDEVSEDGEYCGDCGKEIAEPYKEGSLHRAGLVGSVRKDARRLVRAGRMTTCPRCGGGGYEYAGATSKHCKLCDGVGAVEPGTKPNPEHGPRSRYQRERNPSMTGSVHTASTWYPNTDTKGNFKFDDHDKGGTFVDSDGIIHNNVSWSEAQAQDSSVTRSDKDLPVTVDAARRTAAGEGQHAADTPEGGTHIGPKQDCPICTASGGKADPQHSVGDFYTQGSLNIVAVDEIAPGDEWTNGTVEHVEETPEAGVVMAYFAGPKGRFAHLVRVSNAPPPEAPPEAPAAPEADNRPKTTRPRQTPGQDAPQSSAPASAPAAP